MKSFANISCMWCMCAVPGSTMAVGRVSRWVRARA